MEEGTSKHGFARRKTDAAPATPADSEVDSSVDEETPSSAPETDAADTDIIDAEVIEDGPLEDGPLDDADDGDQDNPTNAHRKRPAAPLRAELPPTTGAIPIERIEAPAAVDVYDYDIDRRSQQAELPSTEEVPQLRRRTDPPPHEARRRRSRRKGRTGWIVATFIFFLLFGTAAALDYYLWNTTQDWEQRAGELTEINYDLGGRLSSEQQTTMQLNSEIDLLTQQLATSNQTVTALSAEKAGAVDESAIYLQEIEALEGNLNSAGSVANALRRCMDGQQELVGYLRDAENYEPEDLEDFSNSVAELCADARLANDRLQESLNQ